MLSAPATVPYGAWPSPISAADVVRAGRRLSLPAIVGGEPWWIEDRPHESGRYAVLRRTADGSIVEVLPAPWNARSRVHEYGGLCWLAVPSDDGHVLVFCHFDDQRIYRLEPGGSPAPLTPAPPTPSADRYADLVLGPDGTEIWCVRESYRDDKVTRHLVAVPLDGSAAAAPDRVRELVGGSDFLAFPRPSADGRRLAWVAWDHPQMPWDGTELRVADISADGTVGRPRVLLGGQQESVLQPEWAGPDSLYVVSDRSGWWNLHRVGLDGSAPEALCPREEEFAGALWTLGQTSYAVLDDGRLAVVHGTDEERLGLLDPATGALHDLDLPYTTYGSTLSTDGRRLAVVGAAADRPTAVLLVDPSDGSVEEVRRATDEAVPTDYLPATRTVTVPGVGGREVHAIVFAPRNPDAVGPDGERPPYVVSVHGGPTAGSAATLDLAVAYFTSRGIGVIDVNYGGSTGFGRAYRERLREQWGVVDVEDCVSAVQGLVAAGEADGERLAIRGGSAGGWTTLASLTGTDVYAAGASYFGVAELEHFVADTHDFESRYVDGLIGPLPETRDRYIERAPLSHVDQVSCPVLLLQGAEDVIVPPSQAEMFRDALVRRGIPYAYLLFPGEQHGFRRAENRITALESELSFYGQVLGFDPPGIPRLELQGGTSTG